jgi:hypothetical protein
MATTTQVPAPSQTGNETQTAPAATVAPAPAKSRKGPAKAKLTAGTPPAPVNAADVSAILAENRRLGAEIAELRASRPDAPAPVSDADFAKAKAKVLRECSASKGEKVLTLNSVLGFAPALTDEQRAAWRKVRKAVAKEHSAWAKGHYSEIRAHFDRAARDTDAIMGAKLRKSDKTGKVLGGRMQFRNGKAPAKAKADKSK